MLPRFHIGSSRTLTFAQVARLIAPEAAICLLLALIMTVLSVAHRRRRQSPALPNPDFPLVRVWFVQRFQVHTGFRVEDQDRLVVDEELDV